MRKPRKTRTRSTEGCHFSDLSKGQQMLLTEAMATLATAEMRQISEKEAWDKYISDEDKTVQKWENIEQILKVLKKELINSGINSGIMPMYKAAKEEVAKQLASVKEE